MKQLEFLISVFFGIAINWLGGYDPLLKALLAFVIIDFITGIIKGAYQHKLKSEISFYGIMKKFMIFIMIAVAVIVDDLLGSSTPLREIVMVFYICNEGISLIENASIFLPIPKQLTKFFQDLKGDNENE